MVKRLLKLPSLPGPDAAHAHKAMARLALADGVIGAGKGKYKAGRSR